MAGRPLPLLRLFLSRTPVNTSTARFHYKKTELNSKKAPRLLRRSASCAREARLLLDNLSLLVSSANLAHPVRKLQFAALVAFNHAGDFQLEVSTALVATSLGNFSKRDCHVPTSFNKLPFITA
jgi:hypothetical protein